MAKKRTRGGYRKPQNPAAVSGPGALSKRTDGKQPVVRVPDVPYGEQAALTAQQQAARRDRAQLAGLARPAGGRAPHGQRQAGGRRHRLAGVALAQPVQPRRDPRRRHLGHLRGAPCALLRVGVRA